MKSADVVRLPMRHPADIDALDGALAEANMAPSELIALWVKTEGNGLGNDFTRPYVEHMCTQWLSSRLDCTPHEAARRVQIIVSGGAEGIVSPHLLAIAARTRPAADEAACKRLVAGIACEPVEASQCGDRAQIERTAGLVHRAMRDAGIENVADVHFAMMRIPCSSGTPGHAMRVRAAGALGVALALEEVSAEGAANALERRAMEVHSSRAFVVARPEDERQQVVVLGNARGSDSRFAAAHTPLADPLDTPAVARMLAGLGMTAAPQLSPADSQRVVAVMIKADPPPGGLVRGWRHVMASDADVAGHRHARSAFAAAVAGVIGHPACFVGAGAEHHGPAQGGLVAVVGKIA